MKKILTTLFSLTFVVLMAMPCFAAEIQENTSIDVNAKFVSEVKNEYKAEVKDKKAEAKLPDGTSIKVEGVTKNGLSLVVIPVEKTDEAAYSWIEENLKTYGTNIYPLDIFFVDAYGNRVVITDNMIITVTIPDGYKTPIICHTDTNGNTTVIDSTVNGKTISFKTNHNSYYSIVEKKSNVLNPTINNNGRSPKTGDNNYMILWLSVLFISGGTTILIIYTKRRKRQTR